MRFMRLTRGCLIIAIVGLATPVKAQTTLGFEGLTGAYVPQGYGGFSWLGGFGTESWGLAAGSGYPDLLRPSSGTQNAWSLSGTTLDMISASALPFDFNSAYLSGVFGGCSGNSGTVSQTVRGFLAGIQTYISTVDISCSTMQQFTFSFLGIDQVTFDEISPAINLLVDDITVNSQLGAVPEPASLTLLATGLVGVLGTAYRRRKVGRAA